jgi:ketosteroid isomerase-like protein
MSQAARAAGDESAAFAPWHQFADGVNAGDMKKATDAYTPNAIIIDEFAPHHWNSFADWNRDFTAWMKANSSEGLHIALSTPSNKEVGPSHAYAVVPTTLTFKVKGKPGSEKGLFTFTTEKTASGWRITGWAWSTL